ncbi:PadR family transcriptional regulator [Streptosporangium sp. NPDC000239]|uniref:PadR family transcriptional regulator n=1 Tax=Streptosporangium sp. NPDC000239 TaxID=3154248 RepID=UPI00333166F4
MEGTSGPVRITKPLLDVLETLIQAHRQGYELHGWAIIKATGRTGPTIYGVLDRLEDAKWIEGHWEDKNPDPTKPPRRFYILTGTGAPAARTLLAERRPEALRPRPATGSIFRGLLDTIFAGGTQ